MQPVPSCILCVRHHHRPAIERTFIAFHTDTGTREKLFTSIDAYISGSLDDGLLHITGKPASGVTLEQAEEAVWQELDKLKTVPVTEDELEKVKNRYESEQIFNNINYLNVATNLAFFELLGRAEDINLEVGKYRSVTVEQIQETARRAFVPENCNILYYKAIK